MKCSLISDHNWFGRSDRFWISEKKPYRCCNNLFWKLYNSDFIAVLRLGNAAILLGCLTSVIFPFTLTAFIAGSCFVLCSSWGIHVVDPIIPLWKKLKFTANPSLLWLVMANICTMQAWSKSEGSESEWEDYWS